MANQGTTGDGQPDTLEGKSWRSPQQDFAVAFPFSPFPFTVTLSKKSPNPAHLSEEMGPRPESLPQEKAADEEFAERRGLRAG